MNKPKNPLVEELANTLINANRDLIESIDDEHYEQSSLIKIYLEMVITSYSQQISYETGKPLSNVTQLLQRMNTEIFNKITEENEKV